MDRVRDGADEAAKVEVRVNGEPVRVWPWGRWQDAVAAWSPEAGIDLARGRSWLEDPSGRPLDAGGRVVDGASIQCRAGRGEEDA